MKTVTKFKKSSIFIIIALLIMPALNSLQAAAAGQYVWTSNNQPSQFPVESRYWADLDYSDDGSIAYGVASGNIFKSIDSGVTWQRLNLLEGANISGVPYRLTVQKYLLTAKALIQLQALMVPRYLNQSTQEKPGR